ISSGSPPITQTTFLACRAHYPGGSDQVPVGCFPVHAAFPVIQAGRHPRLHFRGLLELHLRYGLPGCSPTMRAFCHEASIRPVTRPNRSSATESNRLLLAWVLPPLVICAVGAHRRIQVKSSDLIHTEK